MDFYDKVGGRRDPEAGSMVAAITALTGREPDIVAGKPSGHMFDLVRKKYPEISASRTCIFGDREDTDLQFAISCDMSSVHVMTGVCRVPSADATAHISHFGKIFEEYNS
jgi:ribonucleotide monophosphatase NagD (HAD superfamily)